MRVAFGSDHAGFSLKETLKAELVGRGHDVFDVGASDAEIPVDYPDFGAPVGRAVTTAALARPDRALVHNSEGTP